MARFRRRPDRSDAIPTGRRVGGDPHRDLRLGAAGPAVLVPLSLSGRRDGRAVGTPSPVEARAGEGLPHLRPVRQRLPHGGPRPGRPTAARAVQPVHGLRRFLPARHGAVPLAEKGDRHLLCRAPEGPFRQKVPVPFSLTVGAQHPRGVAASGARPVDLSRRAALAGIALGAAFPAVAAAGRLRRARQPTATCCVRRAPATSGPS